MTSHRLTLLTYVLAGTALLLLGATAHAYPAGTAQNGLQVCTGTQTTGHALDAEPAQGTADTGAMDADVLDPLPTGQLHFNLQDAPADFYVNPQNYCVQGIETLAYPYDNGSYNYNWYAYVGNGTRAETNSDEMPGGIAYNGGHFSYVITGIYVPSAPTAQLNANPTSIVSGDSSSLTWSSTNATSCTGTGFSTGNATSGTVSVSPTSTTNYSVSCTGAGGTATAGATVTVTQPTKPTATLSASPTSITSGSTSTLSYACTNSTSASISPTVGTVTPTSSGTANVTPGSTTTYTLTCTGAGGSATDTATVTVGNVPATPTGLTYSCNASGTAVNFSWTPVSGATTYYPRILQPTAAQCTSYGWQVWTGDNATCLPNPDTDTLTSFSNFPITPGQTYDMWTQAANQYGASTAVHQSIICYAPPSVTCLVNQTSITLGSSDTWTANASGGNGSYIYAWTGSGATPSTGSGQTYSPTYNTAGTYSATVNVTSNGVSTGPVACSNSVTVNNPAAASCTLTANPSSITGTQTSMLTWTSKNATSCTSTNIPTFSGGTSGSVTGVGANQPGNPYQVTCTGAGGSGSCTATVTNTGSGSTCTPDSTVDLKAGLLPAPVTYSDGPIRVHAAQNNANNVELEFSSVNIGTSGGSCHILRSDTNTTTSFPGSACLVSGTTQDVSVTHSTKFTLSCDGVSGTDSVQVNVIPDIQEF